MYQKLSEIYNDLKIDEGLRLYCLVEQSFIIEFKTQENCPLCGMHS
jgi:hypothetical protein